MEHTTSEAAAQIPKNPKLWRIFLMLIVPTVLIFVLITIFVMISSAFGRSDGIDINTVIAKHIGYFFILNHSLAFCLLLWFLRQDGLRLSDIGFRLPDNGAKGMAVEIGLAALSTFIVIGIITSVVPLFEGVKVEDPGLLDADRRLGNGFVLALFASVCVASFVEESIFRGYGMTGLSRHWGLVIAVIITSVLFGVFHISYGVLGVFRTMFQGLVLALLFARSRSLLGPITAHSLTNLIGTLWNFEII